MNTDSLNKPDPMAEDSWLEVDVVQARGSRIFAKLSPESKAAINAYTTNKIIEELVNFRNADFDPNKTLAQTLMYVDARIAELKALNHRKDD